MRILGVVVSSGLLLACQRPIVAPTSAPILPAHASVRVQWPLVDFVVRGDTSPAIEVLAAPNLASEQGTSSVNTVIGVAPDPLSALQWATLVEHLTDSLGRLPSSSEQGLVGPPLRSARGRAFVAIELNPTAHRNQRFVFVQGDSNDLAKGWEATATREEVDELLHKIADVAAWAVHSGTRPGRAFTASGAQACPLRGIPTKGDLDTMPVLVSRRGPDYPRGAYPLEGRVWVQFVVDSVGYVDSHSACVLLSDDALFTAAVRRALSTFRFKPGWRGGRAVNVHAYEEFRFRVRRP